MLKTRRARSAVAMLLSAGLLTGCVNSEEWRPAVEEAFTFEANSGDKADALRGELYVPENRANPDSRQIKLNYVKFPETGDNPGAPIVYLAGGPGGSGEWTAKGRRFPLFMAMREFGDVIAYDQRGTGGSDDTPQCVSETVIPDDADIPRDEMIAMLKDSVDYCETFWREQAIDPAGYTTLESARDLDELRAHLGVEKITLWGISYGTHLALAAAKEMGPRIEKMVMTGGEGLDQTVKLPARTDAYFNRLTAAVSSANPQAAPMIGDFPGLMRMVQAQLAEQPVMLGLPQEDGTRADFLLTKDVMQRLSSAMIADPHSGVQLMQFYGAIAAQQYAPVEQAIARFVTPGEPQKWRVMSLAMDIASGISEERLALVNEQAKTGLIGDYLNFPMPHLRGAMGLDLGEDFRASPQSDIPTLLLSGTLDGRTYPESQQEAFSGFSNLSTVIVENAGHNLFMVSPDVSDVILRFMRGENVNGETITINAPTFTLPGQ
ncbi:MAG: alpha/beta hydrolase [Marinicaulis sp.]|nr:alpha/beta hydrolase [Marinicaulis sp.]